MEKAKYWNLIKELAITDFKLKYNESVFGYLWSLVKPLLYFVVLYLVFTRIFKLGDSIENYPLYLLLGVVLWGFFAEATSMCMQSIVSRGDLIRKVYFPRIVLPVAASLTSFIALVINLIIVFALLIYFGVGLSPGLIFFPLLLLEFYIFALGVSFFLASLIVRFRDIGHIWDVFSQVLFYGTPVIYPLTLVPGKLLNIIMLNPVAQIIQDFRRIVISSDIPSSSHVLGVYAFIPYLLVVVIFVFGYFVFQKMAAKFAEEV